MLSKWSFLMAGLLAMTGGLVLPSTAAAQCNGCHDCLLQCGCNHYDDCGMSGPGYDWLWDGDCGGPCGSGADCSEAHPFNCNRFGAAELDKLIVDEDWAGLGVAVAEGRVSYDADRSVLYELSCTGNLTGQRVLSRAQGDLVALAMTDLRTRLLAEALSSSGLRTAAALPAAAKSN
jgi:hypothetical protein